MAESNKKSKLAKRTSEIRQHQADRLSECLELRKMKPADLIRKYNVDYGIQIPSSHLSMIRKAIRSLPYDYAIAFSEYMDIDSGYLLGADDFTASDYESYLHTIEAEKIIPEHKKIWSKYEYYLKPINNAKIINTMISDDPSTEEHITVRFNNKTAIISKSEMEDFHADIESYIRKALAHMIQKHEHD